MSIPAIIGAAILKLPDAGAEGATVGAMPLIVGGITAAISGILAINLFVALLRKQNFHAFAYYCWVVGALFLLYMR
jgi:undecaprenyl-diphosphatase